LTYTHALWYGLITDKEKFMTKEELIVVLAEHGAWLHGSNNGKRADLSYADLSYANLSYANLSDADLSYADLSYANLSYANLSDANLSYANLRNANLSDADLSYANLSDANLNYANLRNADLNYANLSDANLSYAQYMLPFACPSDGTFTAWKKCANNVLVKLMIPEDAKRLSATGRKCRASKAVVLDIVGASTAYSTHNSCFEYRIGETVYPDCFDEDRFHECSGGIHFFITREEAEQY
jgi:hypothetical protein